MEFSQFKSHYALQLDPQQEAAVQAAEGPVLLLAVPGSGKTTVLVARLGYLLHGRGVPAGEILTMTYTVAAAADMRRRYAALFGETEAARLAFRTINGVCSRIIRLYEQEYGRTAFSLLEEGRKNALLAELLRAQKGEFAGESTVKGLATAITYAKNQMLTDEELGEIEVEGCDFAPLYRVYCRAMRERRLMDYDDQMVYALQILRRRPDLLARLRSRWRWLCVDEAQDTSKIQHAILRMLAGENGNLFLVGDEDQSIYGFRAACPGALTHFEEHYPAARVLYLEQNYRSTAPIVAAADAFIQKNQNRRPKHMRAVRGAGPAVEAVPVWDRHKQYEFLCDLATNCTGETAVLYRDNDSALPLIDRLARAGIPYRCRQVESLFFSHRVVRDITDLLRFAQRPADGALFLTLYYKLGAGIPKALAQEAAARAEQTGQDPLAYLAAHPETSAWTRKRCRELERHLASLPGDRADAAVRRVVQEMGYGAYWEERGVDSGKAEILEALGEPEPTPARLLARLEELRTLVQQGAPDAASPLVLSTIHSSKGLEYDTVLLMDVADGLLPKVPPPAGSDPAVREAWEEERRLFYVGMTRARQRLRVITFQKPGLGSTFARELFPPKPEPAAKPAAPPPAWPPSRFAEPQAPVETDEYVAGVRLRHRVFGPGTLTSRVGDIAQIEFDGGQCKKISLSTALRAHMLQREKQG